MQKNKILPVKNLMYSKSYRIVAHLILALLFVLLPFIFAPSMLETETTFRFMASGVAIALFCALLIFFVFTSRPIYFYSFRSNPFYGLLALYLLYTGLTMSRSINGGEAIYDFLKLLVLSGYFLIFIWILRHTEGGIELLLKYMNISILVFTLIALSQAGLQLGTSNKVRFNFLLSSSLGNKNFYAETITLMLPLILAGVTILKRGWRIVSLINAGLILLTLVLLQTLSTWVAVSVLAGSGCLLFMIASWREKKGWQWLMPIGILLAAGAAFFFIYRSDRFDMIQSRVEKINTYANSSDALIQEDQFHTNSVAERLYLWRNAWHMYLDYPVAGAGYDNWKLYAPKYVLPFSGYAMDNSIRYIRPHNDLLLLLAEGGSIGFLLFLSLFGCIVYLAWRLLRGGIADRTLLLFTLCGLSTYLVIACFSLPGDRFYTQLLLMLFFAVICAAYDATLSNDTPGTDRQILLAVCVLLILSGSVTTYITMRRYASEVHLIYALQAQRKKDWQKMSYHAGMAKSYFFPLDYTATPISWYQGMAAFRSETPAISKYYFEEALRCNPYDLHVLNDLATSLQREGQNAKAAQLYDQVLGMAPFLASAYMNKVVMIYNSGQKDSAYQVLHKYPVHRGEYNDVLKGMLIIKVKTVVPDSNVYKLFFMRKDILAMDSVALSRHTTFEQYVLEDSLIKALSKK